jgi:hypothetical protein
MDLQGFAVVALAMADLAGHVDVGQEVHFYLDDAVAGAVFAAAALDVEAEASGDCSRAAWLPGIDAKSSRIGVNNPV